MTALTDAAFWVLLISIILLAPPLDPGIIVGDFIPDEYQGKMNPLKDETIVVEDVFFPSHGETCHAWLYFQPPTEVSVEIGGEEPTTRLEPHTPAPVVVMAPGLGTQKDSGLDRYAERFVQAGFAVFMFDYRNFAASTGTPRNWVSPKRHIQDYHSALDFIESMPEQLKNKVDSSKVLLWGTSFSGGHVLEVASERKDDTILGVVSQVPHLHGSEASKKGMKTRGVAKTLRMALAVLQDKARQMTGLPPVGPKIIGSGDDMAIMVVQPDDYARYLAKQPKQKLGGWLNQTPARMLLELRRYNPIETLKKHKENSSGIKVGVLLIGSKLDALCPPELIEQASSLLPNSKLILREGSHFEIYEPHHSEPVGNEMIKFYKDCLA